MLLYLDGATGVVSTERDGQAVHLMIDVAGERAVWFGPFTLQRAP